MAALRPSTDPFRRTRGTKLEDRTETTPAAALRSLCLTTGYCTGLLPGAGTSTYGSHLTNTGGHTSQTRAVTLGHTSQTRAVTLGHIRHTGSRLTNTGGHTGSHLVTLHTRTGSHFPHTKGHEGSHITFIQSHTVTVHSKPTQDHATFTREHQAHPPRRGHTGVTGGGRSRSHCLHAGPLLLGIRKANDDVSQGVCLPLLGRCRLVFSVPGAADGCSTSQSVHMAGCRTGIRKIGLLMVKEVFARC